MTFHRGLRAILRQDPDVVMVGEIRDTETAEIAVRHRLPDTAWSFPRCIPTRRWRSRDCRVWA
ncbi:ATPase, T2SS/T4P/T4SS family [Escherichia coli]